MHITVDRTALGTSFTWAAKGLPARPVVPVLTGMLLTVEDNTLTLATFDYERAQRTRLPGTESQPGAILVSGADLKNIISALPKGRKTMVTFSADDTTLTIESGGLTYTLDALPMAEYPALPDVPRVLGTMDSAGFARGATRVAAAAGKDDTLPMLTGVLFEPGADALTMTATDRYRLATENVPWSRGDSECPGIIVPAKPLAEFAAKAGKSTHISIYASDGLDGYISFRDDNRELTIRGISGQFVRYRNQLRTESPANVATDAAALAAAIKQVAPLIERNMPVVLRVTDDTITVMAVRGGVIAASVDVPAVSDAGSFWAGLNGGYLASLLNGFSGRVTLGWMGTDTAQSKPVLLTADDCAFVALAMPIRLIDAYLPADARETPAVEAGTPVAKEIPAAPATAPAAVEAGTPDDAPNAIADEAGTPGADSHVLAAVVPAQRGAVAPVAIARTLECCERYGYAHAAALSVAECPHADDETARILAEGENVRGWAEYAIHQTECAYHLAADEAAHDHGKLARARRSQRTALTQILARFDAARDPASGEFFLVTRARMIVAGSQPVTREAYFSAAL